MQLFDFKSPTIQWTRRVLTIGIGHCFKAKRYFNVLVERALDIVNDFTHNWKEKKRNSRILFQTERILIFTCKIWKKNTREAFKTSYFRGEATLQFPPWEKSDCTFFQLQKISIINSNGLLIQRKVKTIWFNGAVLSQRLQLIHKMKRFHLGTQKGKVSTFISEAIDFSSESVIYA